VLPPLILSVGADDRTNCDVDDKTLVVIMKFIKKIENSKILCKNNS
jgi:hypothetical protein